MSSKTAWGKKAGFNCFSFDNSALRLLAKQFLL